MFFEFRRFTFWRREQVTDKDCETKEGEQKAGFPPLSYPLTGFKR